MHAVALRCEHREDVPCVDDPAPRFSWALEGGRRQTAYRIRVGEGLLDTGRVASSATLDIAYGGRPLPPGSELEWRVQVWDEHGEPSPWSAPARFRTGLAEWSAEWIARDAADDPGHPVPGTDEELDESDVMMRRLPAARYLRRAFVVHGVRSATLYATARGLVELEVNGARVGDGVLRPGWTDYRRRIEYAAHDVTALLREGENVLGAILGDGWYAGFVGWLERQRYGDRPIFLAQLAITYADGSSV